MQDGKPKQTSQHKKGKTRAVIACALAAWVLLTCAYVAFICGLLSDNGKNNSSSNTSDYIAYIGADKKEVNISELFRTHLKNRYGGTYYDGEFVVEKIEVTRTLYATGYSTYAYRADIPELKFFMRSTGADVSTEDRFLESYIHWEGDKVMGKIITDIYGDDVLYQVSVGSSIKTKLLRNGYSDLVAHYEDDKSFPYFQIVVFTKEFDIEDASADAVELYNAAVLGRSENRFYIEILYTNSDDTKRGACYGETNIMLQYTVHDRNNIFPRLYLNYNDNDGDDWSSGYPNFYDYVKDNYWTHEEGGTFYVKPYR